MRPVKLRRILLKVGLGLLLLGLAWPVGGSLASGKSKDLPVHYPAEFTWVGCIDHIKANRVVIDDYLYRFAPYVTFHTPKTPDATRAWFRIGRQVGIVLNSEKQIESMWYLKKCKRR